VERLRDHTESLHDTVGEELGAMGQLVDEPEEEDSEDEEREKDRLETMEKVRKLEIELEEAKVANTLMENRVWKLERTSSRDRSKLEALETKYQEMMHTLSIQAQEQRRNSARLSPLIVGNQAQRGLQRQRRRIPNPFFHPLLFLTAVFWFLLTPLASIFPSFASSHYHKQLDFNSPTSPTSPTHKSRIRLQRTGSKLETVPETDEEDDKRSPNQDMTPEIDLDKDDSASIGESTSPSASESEFPSGSMSMSMSMSASGVTQVSESSSISDIVVYTPARAAYGFVTGILKHGL